MANISFMLIEGISRIDTPYFDNENLQKAYFASKEVGKMEDDSFYPPYYENDIKVSDDDLKLDSKINYLSLYYQNKYYYYFIVDISYIADGLISLHVEMDTLQTFMFSHKIDNCIIERKFIDRWTEDNKINRNYLRENYSNGLFIPRTLVKDDNDNPLVIRKVLIKLSDPERYLQTKFSSNGKTIIDSYFNLLLPLYINYSYPYGDDFWAILNIKNNQPVTLNDVACKLIPQRTFATYIASDSTRRLLFLTKSFNSDIFKIDYAHKIVYVDTDYFDFTSSNQSSYTDSTYNFKYFEGCPLKNDVDIPIKTNLNSLSIKDSNNENFTINKYLNQNYDEKYAPVLVDENYIQYEYGEYSATSSSSLFILSTPTLNYGYLISPISGSRFYYMGGYSDIEYTKIIVSSNVDMPIITDYYNQYISRNNATLGATIGYSVLSTAAKFFPYAREISTATDVIGKIYSKKSSYDKRYSQSRLKKTSLRKIGEQRQDIAQSAGEAAIDALSSLSPILNESIARENLKYQPSDLKFDNDYGTSFLYLMNETGYRISYVQDFSQVAWFYHRNGYLVNEHYYKGKWGNIFGETNDDYQITNVPDIQEGEVYEEQMQIPGIVKAISANVTTNDDVDVSSATIKSVVGNIVTIQFNARSQGATEAVVNISLSYIYAGTIDNLLDYINNRHYFNVVKLRDIDITLDDIEPQELVDDLKSRYEDGLRLWNSKFDLTSTYKYDNVERKYVG